MLREKYAELVNMTGYKIISGDMANLASRAWLNTSSGWVAVPNEQDVWRWEGK